MRMFPDALGYNPDFEDNRHKIAKEFIARTTQWLKKYWQILQRNTQPVDPKSVDPKMYTGGREEGHMNKTIKYPTNWQENQLLQHPSYTFWFTTSVYPFAQQS